MRVEAERLLLQAQEDLASARVLFQGARFYAAAFFAQQTAEKALKALYIERFLKLPRTHDLIELAEALGAETGLLEQARLLTPDYLLTRYPDAAGTVPARLYRQDEARDRLKGDFAMGGVPATNRLVEVLSGAALPIEQAWLFGSRARGDALEDSDWDLLVVSGAFRGVPYLKRLQTLYRLPLRRAEYVALTPEELEARRDEIGIVGEALREGIRLL